MGSSEKTLGGGGGKVVLLLFCSLRIAFRHFESVATKI